MKNFLKKALKTLLVFIISTIVIYFILTLTMFFRWCNYYGIYVCAERFGKTPEDYALTVSSEKMIELGEGIRLQTKMFEDAIDEANSKGPGEYPLISDFFDEFDPLGYVVWLKLQRDVSLITCEYISISLFLGIAVSISYVIITNKKLNNIFKFILGYVSILIAFPPLYMYSWTGRFWELDVMYIRSVPKYFYIAYTIIFIVMFGINYIISLRMAKKLNEAISKKEENG